MVYFIFDTITNLTKVGFSKDPNKRYNALKTANPNLILVFSTDLFSEVYLHKKFKQKRVYLEWFKLDLNDYIEIKGTKKGLPKTLYYKKKLPRFKTGSNHIFIPNTKFKLTGFENYILGVDNNIYNIFSGKKIKKVLKGYTSGYNLNCKFLSCLQINKLLTMA